MDPDIEEACFRMIAAGGESRSMVFEALKLGGQGKMNEAWKKLEESRNPMAEAHKQQTKLIQKEAQGKLQGNSILLAHAQDILMASLTERDLAEHILSSMERLQLLEEKSG